MLNIIRSFGSISEIKCPCPTSFNYDHNGEDWELPAGQSGKKQSPISLSMSEACKTKTNNLYFLNYNKVLSGPLTLNNNGHTAVLNIPAAKDHTPPCVCGCYLESVYTAQQLHFHWGSSKSKGSEHIINCTRYDGELHIVHKNCAYKNVEKAMCYPDGFLVLGILLRCVPCPEVESVGLNKICEKLKGIKEYGSDAKITCDLKLNELFGDIDKSEFFFYKGSLTTPPCAEAVNWFVFPKPVEISRKYMKLFWYLQDTRGECLINNYRNIQDTHDRIIYFRRNK